MGTSLYVLFIVKKVKTIKDNFLNLTGLTKFYEKLKSMIGAARGFTGTKAEVQQAIDDGEITDGMIVNITDDYDPADIFDDELSVESENAVQNKVVTAAIIKTLKKISIEHSDFSKFLALNSAFTYVRYADDCSFVYQHEIDDTIYKVDFHLIVHVNTDTIPCIMFEIKQAFRFPENKFVRVSVIDIVDNEVSEWLIVDWMLDTSYGSVMTAKNHVYQLDFTLPMSY